ncbi:MAG: hypothetical protein RL154_1627 [Pseudomonadota bacterium]|jgi:peptidyl-prolyl cis-trans isomerase A (cyclophilin A)/peptidyl-prolyl cis-trans isomerase B (cyclophilin B)
MELKQYDISPEALEPLKYALIETENGTIKIKLLSDEAPNTVANFASMANDGFYDGLTFHRVIKGFMAQGGCPAGNGRGGPKWNIACECDKNTSKHKKGTLSMAHAGRDTGGSQFFICFGAQPHLDGIHTVFGQIEDKESLDILAQIKQNDIMKSVKISAE